MAATTAHIAIDSFTTVVNGERRWVHRGKTYPGDDPVVLARPTLFRAVSAYSPEPAADQPKPTRRRK